MDSVEQQSSLACANCGSANVSLRHVRSAFWQDDRLVVVQDIPALVCGACAEQFYDDATVVELDQLRGQGFPVEQARTELRVPVFSFGDRAANKSRP
jgi:YgiT-type zinc finger domain-containing protein